MKRRSRITGIGHIKLGVIAALLLTAACAPSRSPSPLPSSIPGRPAPIPERPASTPTLPPPPAVDSAPAEPMPGRVTNPTKPASNYSQDAVECERKAALSQVGGRGEAFASCMRARGYSAGR